MNTTFDKDHSEDEYISDYGDLSDDDEYRCTPPSPDKQHARLEALRKLISMGISCILWGEDALIFAHLVKTQLYHQKILAPDHQLDDAVSALGQLKYTPVPMNGCYIEILRTYRGTHVFPNGKYLQHAEMPGHNPRVFDPIPNFILLLPQSYFDLDVRAIERFQTLVPPLDNSNKDILVPKFHTFLEACVEAIMNPPSGLDLWKSKYFQDIAIYSLLMSRTQTDLEGEPELSPLEVQIIDELQTSSAKWYIHRALSTGKIVSHSEVEEYRKKAFPEYGLPENKPLKFAPDNSVFTRENVELDRGPDTLSVTTD